MLKNSERPDKSWPRSFSGNRGNLKGVEIVFQHKRCLGINLPGRQDGELAEVG